MLAAIRPLLRAVSAHAHRLALVSCAAIAVGAATGCSPVVTVHHTEVRGLSTSGLDIVAVLEVENENGFDVEIRRVRANVVVADRYRLDPIDIQPNKWIGAGRKVKVSVPVTIPWTTIPGVLSATVGSSEVAYHVSGTADVTAGRSLRVKQNHYPIDQDGTIPRSMLSKGRGGGLPFPF
ncbi:Hypothetical protein A7982_10023 [Minicystis rosea]|nr:Hypothetical protein A7982_10023 [Minicystis rosea]